MRSSLHEAESGGLPPGIRDAVSALTVRVRRVMEGLQGGAHASLHLGASVEFSEHQRYSHGDDIRRLDWRALARTDRLFVKRHLREVHLRCLVLLDCSASMGYRGTRAELSKLGYGALIATVLAHILVRQGDAVGLLAFAGQPLLFLPPERRPDHLPVLMRHIAALEPAAAPGTGFTAAIGQGADRVGHRAMIVLLSDLWGATRPAEVALGNLAARGHDVALFHVLSPDEIDLPFASAGQFAGLEGEGVVEADPARIRDDYRRELEAHVERWRRVCGKAGIDMLSAATSEPAAAVIGRFARRRHRAGAGT